MGKKDMEKAVISLASQIIANKYNREVVEEYQGLSLLNFGFHNKLFYIGVKMYDCEIYMTGDFNNLNIEMIGEVDIITFWRIQSIVKSTDDFINKVTDKQFLEDNYTLSVKEK